MDYILKAENLTKIYGHHEEKEINFQISQDCEISTHYSVETENVSDTSVRIAC